MDSFEDYVRMDPRIGELLKEAQAIKAIPGERFCANRTWYGNAGEPGLKGKMVHLVGECRSAGPRELQTSVAYDTVYERIYSALPDCRDCCCCC